MTTTAEGARGTDDWFSSVLEHDSDPDRRALLERRPVIAEHLQANFAALFEPVDPSDLSLIERYSAAIAASRASGAETLVDAYYARLELVWGQPIPAVKRQKTAAEISDPRLKAIAEFSQKVAADPVDVGTADYEVLRAAGISESALVTLTLLIGFVSYQVRALAGLELLAGANR